LSLEKEKAILRQIYTSGVCAIAFEGGEPQVHDYLGINTESMTWITPLVHSMSG